LLLARSELRRPQLLRLRNKLGLAAGKLIASKLAAGKGLLSLGSGGKPAVKLSKWVAGSSLLLLLLKLGQISRLWLLLEGCTRLQLWRGSTAEGCEGSLSVLLLCLLLELCLLLLKNLLLLGLLLLCRLLLHRQLQPLWL
jgi:hypothetical protein